MSESKIEARARVRLVVEIDIPGGSWSGEEKLENLHRQALENAETCLRQGLVINGLQIGKQAQTIGRIIGEPEIDAITFRSKR